MTLPDIVFVIFAVLTLGAGLMAVALRNVFYNALSLILCLFGVAGLFIYLNSEFLAVMEVIVYIGAISIAIIFAIMLSRPMLEKKTALGAGKIVRSLLIGIFLFAGLQKVIRATAWPSVSAEGDYSIGSIGKNLLTVSVLPFEAVSIVLLVAIIGALVISNTKETP